MKKHLRSLSLVLGLGLFAGMFTSLSVHADSSDEVMYPAMKQELGYMGYTTDNSFDLTSPSFMFAEKFPLGRGTPDGQKFVVCKTTQSAGCTDPAYSLWFHANLSKCTSATETDCIEQLGILNSDQSITNATFVRDYNQSGNFTGDPALGIPNGHGQNTWTFPDGSGTQLMSVQVSVEGLYERKNSAANIYAFSAALQPIKEVAGTQFYDPAPKVIPGLNTDRWSVEGAAKLLGCQIQELNLCGMRQSLDLNKTYVLKVRLHSKITGWLHGRLKDAGISIESATDGGQVVSVQAKPLQVPVASAWVKWGDLPASLQARYPAGSGGYASELSGFTVADVTKRTLLVSSQVAGKGALDEINDWLPLLGNKATNMKSFWTVRTISGQLPGDLGNCTTNEGVTGFIGTNSAVYSDGPPTFDTASGSLNYTVASPHFDSTGNVFNGIYQLSLKSDVARCIYHFTNAPISAKIEIASSDGSTRVASTSVGEKDGWLNLSASGFEFSSPTVKVKLTQDAPAVVAPETKPTVAPVAPKPVANQITITCTKGKISKKVTAIKPTCPKGYIKK